MKTQSLKHRFVCIILKMIRITLILISVAVFSTSAEPLHTESCYYPENVEGPLSANLIKKDDGFELEVKFWANQIGPDSPLKVKRFNSNFNSVTKLVDVLYPIKTATADKYTENTINIPIPKTEVNSDKIKLTLYKNDGKETPVWCMVTSIRGLNGMKEEVTTMPPSRVAICPPGPKRFPVEN